MNRKYFDYTRSMVNKGQVRIITKKQLSKMLCISESTIYRMLKRNDLPEPLYTPAGYVKGWLSTSIEVWVLENSF